MLQLNTRKEVARLIKILRVYRNGVIGMIGQHEQCGRCKSKNREIALCYLGTNICWSCWQTMCTEEGVTSMASLTKKKKTTTQKSQKKETQKKASPHYVAYEAGVNPDILEKYPVGGKTQAGAKILNAHILTDGVPGHKVRLTIECTGQGCTNARDIYTQDAFQVRYCEECTRRIKAQRKREARAGTSSTKEATKTTTKNSKVNKTKRAKRTTKKAAQ